MAAIRAAVSSDWHNVQFCNAVNAAANLIQFLRCAAQARAAESRTI
jgi:hypothetical protein